MPSGIVGTLRINLVANSASFSAELKKARESIKGFAGDSKADIRSYQSEAARLFKETRTDAERYAASMERLKALHARGLDDSTFARASAKLRQEFSSQIPLMDRWQDKLRSMFAKQGTEDLPLLAAISANAPKLLAGAGIAAGLAAIAAAAATAATALAMTKQRWSEMIEIGRSAQVLSMSIEGMVGLREAAEKTGTPIETLTMPLARMQKRIGEGVAGETGAVDIFGRIGLDPKQLAKMDPSEAFVKIADALQTRVPSAAERAAAAIDIFGRSGYQLLPMLQQGESGLKKMMEEVKRLGLVFKEGDYAKLRAAGHEIRKAGDVFRAAFTSVAVGAAPGVQELGESLVEVAKAFGDLMKEAQVGEAIADAFRMAATAIRSFHELIKETKALLDSLPTISGETGNAMKKMFESAFPNASRWLDLFSKIRQVLPQRSGATSAEGAGTSPFPKGGMGAGENIYSAHQMLAQERERVDLMVRFGIESESSAAKLDKFIKAGATAEMVEQFRKAIAEGENLKKVLDSLKQTEATEAKLRDEFANYRPGEKRNTLQDELRRQFMAQGANQPIEELKRRQGLMDIADIVNTRRELGGMFEASLDPLEKFHKKIEDIGRALRAGVFGEGPAAMERAKRAADEAAREANPWVAEARRSIIDRSGLTDKEVERARRIEEAIQRWGANSAYVDMLRRANAELTRHEALQRAVDRATEIRERLNPQRAFGREIQDIDRAVAMGKLNPQEAMWAGMEARRTAKGRMAGLLEDMFPTYQAPSANLRGSQAAYNTIVNATMQANDPKLALMQKFDIVLDEMARNIAEQTRREPIAIGAAPPPP